MKFLVILVSTILQFSVSTKAQNVSAPPLNITVFYETLCPYSMSFFRNQLGPVWEQLGRFINLELVPYGHATQTYQDDTWHFTCQHGENECKYNIFHSCVIKIIEDRNTVVRILTCLMAMKRENQLFDYCLSTNDIDYKTKIEIESCYNGEEGKELLSGHGNRTMNSEPEAKYIPCELFNGVYNEAARADAYYDLKEVVCRFLHPKPPDCVNLYYIYREK